MLPSILLEQARTPGGALLELYQRGGDFTIRVDGKELMSSRLKHSEIELAKLGVEGLSPAVRAGSPRVLVGGLGCGYTCAAALEALPPSARVAVSELSPVVVEWNRGPLGPLANHPLDDPRVEVIVGDFAELLREGRRRFDAILLDLDNGPAALCESSNSWLYTEAGLRAAQALLRRGGVYAVWSAGPDAAFSRRLKAVGFEVSEHPVRAHTSARGKRHMIWRATRRA